MEDMQNPIFSAISVDANNMADVLLENSLKVCGGPISLQEILD